MASTWRVNNSTALGGEVCSPWQANHAYATGARCVCTVAYATTTARAFVYEVTDDGTSHATTQPTWPTTVGNTVSDGTVTWTCRSPSDGSWDNATCYLFYMLGYAAAAGDTVYIDDGHSEAGIGATMTITASSTATNPTKIYCVDKADDSISTGAVVATGNQELRLAGYAYSYGVQYSAGSGRIIFTRTANTSWIFEGGGTKVLKTTSTSSIYGYSNTYRALCVVINGNIDLSNSSGATSITLGYLVLHWYGGTLIASNGVDALLTDSSAPVVHKAVIKDVDLSALGQDATAAVLANFSAGYSPNYDILFERCKLPSDEGFAVSSFSWPTFSIGKIILNHCSSANQVYDIYEASYEGVSEDSTSIYRDSGASNGTTASSIKMVSSSGCLENIVALESPPIHGWTSSTTEATFTVEGVWDSATNIQDDEIWMELEYPADNSSGLGAITKDKCAILGTPADQTASTEDWTGTSGFSNENKFKLSVTVTPGKAGPITARVYLAKASTTVYIDPMITES